jgi:uncharacterized protein (TIGR02266 family)
VHRVLLIDDVQLVLRIQKAWLEERRLEVTVAQSAEEAFSLLQDYRPDLVVVDYEMPGSDGVQFCQQIKADRNLSRIPVIILSAHTDDATIRRCLAAGAVAFVSKTGGREELLNNIANVLRIPYRRHMRLKCSVSVRIKKKSTESESAMIKDISVSGLLLVTNQPLAVGTSLELRFVVPRQQQEITILARVVRTEDPQEGKPCCGIQFSEMDVESKRQIRQFVEHSI